MKKEILCDYCKKEADYVDSKAVYGRSYGMIYLCQPCDAYVGVHRGTDTPLGRLAKKDLRDAKIKAHAYFDQLWKKKIVRHGVSKKKARSAGYKWLSEQLGISRKKCHIGMFDVEMCNAVVDVCEPYLNKRR